MPRSDMRIVTWCSDCGLCAQNSYIAVGSGIFVFGFFFCECIKSGNFMASLRKKTGVLLPTISQLPWSV